MKRPMLFAAVAACTFSLTVNARSGVAETKTPVSHAPRAIAIEVLIVGAKGGAKDGHTAELSGPTDEVAARLRELESKGQIAVIDRIRLTTLENQETLVQAGKTTPVATGRTLGGRGGPAQMSYHHQNVGTQISATAIVAGDAIVVELEVEKSQLERHASKPRANDEFVPLGTETLTSQVTVRIGSGKTVLASGLETRVDAELSGQLVLASARLLEPSTAAEDLPPTVGAHTRQIRIFSLQHASAKDVAAVIKELLDHDSGQISIGVDSRTNSLIIRAEKGRLEVIEAILLRLDESDPRRVVQALRDEEKSDPTPVLTKYNKMEKKNLQEELKRLLKEVLGAEPTARQAKAKATEAARAYKSASDDKRPDALLRMIEADAASRGPMERYAQIVSDFDAAKRAYLELLLAE